MAGKYLIPRASAPFVDAAGHPTREWYNWLRALDVLFASSDANVQAEIEAIARALGSPDGSVEKIPPQDNAQVGKVIGINSVATYGVLPNVVQVQLLNDVATADPTSYYGSDDAGNKGWHPMVDAFGTTTLDLTVDEDTGVVSFDLADLADSGTGTFKLITRDAKGRVSGTKDGTTDDVPEGSTNLYFTAPRAQAAVVVSGITEGDTTHSPSGDAVFDALAGKIDSSEKAAANGVATLGADAKLDPGQLPALAITETFVVNTEAAMLALDCQQGDVAVRTDESTSYILTAEPASTLSNWQELLTPTGGVSSFNGRTGSVTPASGDYTPAQVGAEPAISAGTTAQYWRGDKSWQTLDKAAVGLGNVDNTSDAGKPVSTAQQAALDLKFDKSGGTIAGRVQIVTAGGGNTEVNYTDGGCYLTYDSGSRLRVRSASGTSYTTKLDVTDSGAAYSVPVAVSSGTSNPLNLTTSSGSPWAITLTRSDLGSSSSVLYKGTGWDFQHTVNSRGSVVASGGSGEGLKAFRSNGTGFAYFGTSARWIGHNGSTYEFAEGEGNVEADGFDSYSDPKLKTGLMPMVVDTAAVDRIGLWKWHWNDLCKRCGKPGSGVRSDEVRRAFPQCARKGVDGLDRVNYGLLGTHLGVTANQRIAALEARLAALEAKP